MKLPFQVIGAAREIPHQLQTLKRQTILWVIVGNLMKRTIACTAF